MTFSNTITRKISLAIFALLLFAPYCFVSAQTAEVEPKVIVTVPVKQKFKRKHKKMATGNETSVEKSIAVDVQVNITLCVAEGNLKVTGWERSEIRAFVSNGNEIGFNVRQKNRQNKAAWLTVTGSGATATNQANSRGCLSGEEIELDVPRGATVNIESGTSETTIETVRKVFVKNVGGDISLNNIEEGITASTYQGDVIVESSGGAITLATGNGNIVAFDVAPSEIGDVFKAKTSSGAITLQRIEHRQTEINSNSGSIKFAGEFQNGGQYTFGTTNGTISLVIPENSSCKINASYGFGAFNSDFKLLNVVKNPASNKTQSLTALMGSGDASVNLRTYSGAILIRKQ